MGDAVRRPIGKNDAYGLAEGPATMASWAAVTAGPHTEISNNNGAASVRTDTYAETVVHVESAAPREPSADPTAAAPSGEKMLPRAPETTEEDAGSDPSASLWMSIPTTDRSAVSP